MGCRAHPRRCARQGARGAHENGSNPIARPNRRSNHGSRPGRRVPASRRRVRGATRSRRCRAVSRGSIARAGCAASPSAAGSSSSPRAFRASPAASSRSTSRAWSRSSSASLYLSQFRAGLIDARVQSLVVQGEIIAGAIAASATADSLRHHGRPRPHCSNCSRARTTADDGLTGLEFSINPERVAPVLRRLISPTKTRARIYDRDGYLILDSRNLYIPRRGAALRPAAAEREEAELLQARLERRASVARPRRSAALPRARAGSRQGLSRGRAGAGRRARAPIMVRITDRGEVIVSVAVPVQRFRAVRGALLLSTQGGDINQAVEAERAADLQAVPDPARASWWCCRCCSRAPSPAR